MRNREQQELIPTTAREGQGFSVLSSSLAKGMKGVFLKCFNVCYLFTNQ